MALLAIFLAKFTDPVSFLIAGIAGMNFNKRYQILIVGIITALSWSGY